MYCPQCGGANEDTARFCSACGLDLSKYKEEWQSPGSGPQTSGQPRGTYQQPLQNAPPYQQQYQPAYQAPQYRPTAPYGAVPNVPSYMGWAIAVLILCFWPTGIAAVVYASQVGNKLALGDIAGAQQSSRKAKTWCWITFGIGVAFVVIAGIAYALALSAAVTVY